MFGLCWIYIALHLSAVAFPTQLPLFKYLTAHYTPCKLMYTVAHTHKAEIGTALLWDGLFSPANDI